jgi:hypothetical protein
MQAPRPHGQIAARLGGLTDSGEPSRRRRRATTTCNINYSLAGDRWSLPTATATGARLSLEISDARGLTAWAKGVSACLPHDGVGSAGRARSRRGKRDTSPAHRSEPGRWT